VRLDEIELQHARFSNDSANDLAEFYRPVTIFFVGKAMQQVPGTRDRFIDTAARLFMRQGYHGTGLAQIVAESGAPKGSLYFHFPGGKEGLAAASVVRAGDVFARQLDATLAASPDPADAVQSLCTVLARWMEMSEFREGCPITNACLELTPSNAEVTAATHDIFSGWRRAWETQLSAAGWPEDRAIPVAATIVTALEGAFIVARAARSTEPFERVRAGLSLMLAGYRPHPDVLTTGDN
jgi:TetR/AcrR family transcriptional regulator, lmrAB and yxaGH operons repressor